MFVGPHDHVEPGFEACSINKVFWRVPIKVPVTALSLGRGTVRRCMFGLPGDHFSAIVCGALLVLATLQHLRGTSETPPALRPRRWVPARPTVGQPARRSSSSMPDADGCRGMTDQAPGLGRDGALGEDNGFAVTSPAFRLTTTDAEVDLLRV